jgi:nitrate/nitrite transport system ATP-binding protein
LFYAVRNHLVDFLVSRSKTLSHGKAPVHPPEVRPGVDPEPEPAPIPASPSTTTDRVALHRVA